MNPGWLSTSPGLLRNRSAILSPSSADPTGMRTITTIMLFPRFRTTVHHPPSTQLYHGVICAIFVPLLAGLGATMSADEEIAVRENEDKPKPPRTGWRVFRIGCLGL